MGQKVNPIGFRLGVRRKLECALVCQQARLFKFMAEDNLIRGFWKRNCVLHPYRESLSREPPREPESRSGRPARHCNRPKRPGLDSLRDSLNQVTGKDVRLEIREIKKPDLVASLVAESEALQLELELLFGVQ